METIQEHVEATEHRLKKLNKDHAKLQKAHTRLKAAYAKDVKTFATVIKEFRADNAKLVAAQEKRIAAIEEAHREEVAQLREANAHLAKVLNTRFGRPRMPWGKHPNP